MNKNSVIKTSSMLIGATGAVVAAYNIAADGKMIAHGNTKEELGEHYVDIYVNSMSSPKKSTLISKMKDAVTMKRIDSPVISSIITIKNYILGFGKAILGNLDIIAASALALGIPLLMRKPKTSVKPGWISKTIQKIPLIKKLPTFEKHPKAGIITSAVAAGYLVFDAARIFVSDVLGVGKEPY